MSWRQGRKLVGALSFYGTPKFTYFYCTRRCADSRTQDHELLDDDDRTEQWVMRRKHVMCDACGRPVFTDRDVLLPEESMA